MDQKERQVIDDLFGKLRQVEGQTAQRDREAEAHIQRQVASLPAAPYYMAQAILVQEQALAGLQTRLQQLEQQVAQQPASGGGGGFLSGLFGGGQGAAPPARQMRPPAHQQPGYPQHIPPQYMQPPGGGMMGGGMMGGGGPWGGGGRMGGGGGGFLAGAMQTAVGVAGGMLVADALGNAFDSATVSESELAGVADQAGAEAGAVAEDAGFQDAGYEDPGAADMGGDFGGDEAI